MDNLPTLRAIGAQGGRREILWAGDTIPGPSTLANLLRTFGAQCVPTGNAPADDRETIRFWLCQIRAVR